MGSNFKKVTRDNKRGGPRGRVMANASWDRINRRVEKVTRRDGAAEVAAQLADHDGSEG